MQPSRCQTRAVLAAVTQEEQSFHTAFPQPSLRPFFYRNAIAESSPWLCESAEHAVEITAGSTIPMHIWPIVTAELMQTHTSFIGAPWERSSSRENTSASRSSTAGEGLTITQKKRAPAPARNAHRS